MHGHMNIKNCYILLSHTTSDPVATHYYYFDDWALLPLGENIPHLHKI